jgi:hypothetical protein
LKKENFKWRRRTENFEIAEAEAFDFDVDDLGAIMINDATWISILMKY